MEWEGEEREWKDICINLYLDEKSAMDIAHNPTEHNRAKHIEINRHFIREKLDNGTINTSLFI